MGDDTEIGRVLIFAVVQVCTAEYVVYGWKTTLDNNLSGDCFFWHNPLIIITLHETIYASSGNRIFSLFHVIVSPTEIIKGLCKAST